MIIIVIESEVINTMYMQLATSYSYIAAIYITINMMEVWVNVDSNSCTT